MTIFVMERNLFKPFLLFVTGVLLSLDLQAGLCQTAWGEFVYRKQRMENRLCYGPGRCHANIIRFVSDLGKKNDFVLSEANVLLITPITEHVLRPINTFTEFLYQRTDGWSFHVVLEYKGLIYDFDFNEFSPRAISKKLYFESMFKPKDSYQEERLVAFYPEVFEGYSFDRALQNISVTTIPANWLLENYGKRSNAGMRWSGNSFLYNDFELHGFKTQSVADYTK